MSTNSVRQIDAIGLCLALLAMGAIYFGAISPLLRAHETESRRAAESTAIRDRTIAAQSDLADTRRSIEDTRQALGDAWIDLQPVSMLNHKVAQLSAAAERSGCGILSMTPGDEVQGELSAEVDVQLVANSSFTNTAAFLRTLAETEPAVAAVRITQDAGDLLRTGDETFEITLRWYAEPSTPQTPVN